MLGRSYYIECEDRIIEVVDYDDKDNSEKILSLARKIAERNSCINWGIDFMKIRCTFEWRYEFLKELPLCYRVKEYIFESKGLAELLKEGCSLYGENIDKFLYCKEVERGTKNIRFSKKRDYGCTNLTNVTIPKGIEIDREAFSECPFQKKIKR